MADSIIFREDVLIESKKLSVGDDFDVNNTVVIAASTGNVTGVADLTTTGNAVVGGTTNFQGNVSANGTQFLDVTTGALSNIGTVGCGAVTSTGAVQGTILTDGTLSVTGGDITDAGSISATTLTDGTISISAGEMTGASSLSATTLTDGTLSCTGGDITGAGSITATTLTDGTLSCTAGDITGAGNITASTLTDGTFSVNSGAITGLHALPSTALGPFRET